MAAAALLACLLPRSTDAQAAPSALGMPPSETSSQALFDFDIPAQGLGSALERYSRQTGIAVLVDERYAAHPASAVRGRYDARQALQRLLAGTALTARYAAYAHSIVVHGPAPAAARASVLPAPALVPVGSIPGVAQGGDRTREYVGRIQQALSRALCGSPASRPGGYRLALQLRLDADGAVQRMRLLDTTGNPARDAAVSAVVRRLHVGWPPPAAMPQPVSILLLPAGPHDEPACPDAAVSRG
ncbi:STN domain-containing protein [Bordetella ansorpii]|nr:STN domain-containing protein [Bordetella ansorpii]